MSVWARGSMAVLLPPTCGTSNRLGACHSGWSEGRGSGSTTSSAAWIRSRRSSASRASVSTTGPRAMLTSSAPSLRCPSISASKSPVVSSVPGTISTTTSAPGSSSGSSQMACTPSRARRATLVTRASNGSSRASIASPIWP